ncbi:MAG: hypothetical protein QXH27_04605, partial [Candidatus Micrarchaeia archaeon]
MKSGLLLSVAALLLLGCLAVDLDGMRLAAALGIHSNYTSGATANLSIWDSNDPEGGSLGLNSSSQINFYANYTNASGAAITNESDGGICQIEFDTAPTGPFNMSFNLSGNNLYEYNR